MTPEEFERTGNWSNDEYFDYMKDSGNWLARGSLAYTGKPCDRCEQDGLKSCKIESLIDVVDDCTRRYTAGTEFEICLLCMLELYGATYSKGKEEEML